jgi:hypothetical protein
LRRDARAFADHRDGARDLDRSTGVASGRAAARVPAGDATRHDARCVSRNTPVACRRAS